MKTKQIKDLNASAIGFGCWAIGGTWNGANDERSIKAIHTAIDSGINFFDVAPVYGKGHSETVLGKAIKGLKREDLIIATKCGLPWEGEGNPRNDLSRASIIAEVEESLVRLGTDYIDLYQTHWPDTSTSLEETGKALDELKQQGKIRHVGVCNYSLDMVRTLSEHVEVATFQGLYNLLEQNPEHYHNIPLEYRVRSEVLPFCADNDMMFLPYSPLMQGLLTGSFKPEGNFDNKDDRHHNPKLNGETFKSYYECSLALNEFAQKLGRPLAQMAINWLIEQKTVGPVIAGAITPEQVKQNVACVEWSMSQEIFAEMESIVARFNLR